MLKDALDDATVPAAAIDDDAGLCDTIPGVAIDDDVCDDDTGWGEGNFACC